MSRSLKKGPYVDERLQKKILAQNETKQKSVIKTWARESVITPEMVGHTLGVHNGREHVPVFVSENMVGHRLGEFSPTRKFHGHGGKKAAAEKKAEAQSRAKQEATAMQG
jgi:small subunit ribosomal protein S19